MENNGCQMKEDKHFLKIKINKYWNSLDIKNLISRQCREFFHAYGLDSKKQ
jgi:hypothetical protein